MATVPNIFEGGTTAFANEMNENFEYVMEMLGGEGSSGVAIRRNNNIFAGYSNGHKMYWSYNAKETESQTGAPRNYERIEDGLKSYVVTLGVEGFQVWGTSATQGTLSSQLNPIIQIVANKTYPDYIYLNPSFTFLNHSDDDDKLPELGHHRFTYTPLTNPITVYENAYISSKSTVTRDAYKLGVPQHAKMIRVMAYITPTFISGSGLQIMQARSSRHMKYGTIIHTFGGAVAGYGRAAGEGDVPLGTGSYKGQFVEHRTAPLTTASLWIKGYYS